MRPAQPRIVPAGMAPNPSVESMCPLALPNSARRLEVKEHNFFNVLFYIHIILDLIIKFVYLRYSEIVLLVFLKTK